MKEFIKFVSLSGNEIVLSTDIIVCVEENNDRTAVVYFEDDFEIKAVKTRTQYLTIVEKLKQGYYSRII